MAERKIKLNDWLLFVKKEAETTFDIVVCLKDWGFGRTRASIDAKSFCGPDKSTGQLEAGPITFNGISLIEVANTKVSIAELDSFIKNNDTLDWKISTAVPETGDVTYLGKGAISKLDDSATTDENPSFSAEITIFGNYSTIITP
jgi:hypothetical protein